VDVQDFADVEKIYHTRQSPERIPWDKSRIIDELAQEPGLSRQTARVVAAMVEERIFSMGMTLVPQSLLKQLVLGEAASILRAERDLQKV
jgi:hypothetical protein